MSLVGGSDYLLGCSKHKVRVDFQEQGLGNQVQGCVCGRIPGVVFQGCPWAWGFWEWEMGQQAEVRLVGRNPDLQRLRRGQTGGMALRLVSLGVGAGLGPGMGYEK